MNAPISNISSSSTTSQARSASGHLVSDRSAALGATGPRLEIQQLAINLSSSLLPAPGGSLATQAHAAHGQGNALARAVASAVLDGWRPPRGTPDLHLESLAVPPVSVPAGASAALVARAVSSAVLQALDDAVRLGHSTSSPGDHPW